MNEQVINHGCQAEAQDELSLRRSPGVLFGPKGMLPWVRRRSVVLVSAARILREHGPVFTLRKTMSLGLAALRRRLPGVEHETWKTPATEGADLNLQPGEWVEVRTLPEIVQTLDSQGKTHGLYFVNEMKLHCGRRYRVFKRVKTIFNEFTKEQRKVRNTVLLETVFCRGEGLGCDRSCFHMWREAWLRRVGGPAAEIVDSSRNQLLPILNAIAEDGGSACCNNPAYPGNSASMDGPSL